MTSKQRAHLRSLAHSLKPILQIGKDGVTDAALEAIEDAFNTRELLKLRVLDTAPLEPDETASAVARRLPDTHVVQVIGSTVVLYRPEPEDPDIELPE